MTNRGGNEEVAILTLKRCPRQISKVLFDLWYVLLPLKNRFSSINLPIFKAFDLKNKIFPKFLVRLCILTPSEYSVFGESHFNSIYYNFQTNCCIILLFFLTPRARNRSRQPLRTFWALTRFFYWLAIHAVTSSIFAIPAPVESRHQGGNDEP